MVLCRTEVAAQEALAVVRAWTSTVGLTLHPVKTRIVDTTQDDGFDFLGYHFESGQRWPRQKSLDKFKDTIRAQTRRHNGQSLQAVVTDLNRTLRGWFEYFKHSHRFTFTATGRMGAHAAAEPAALPPRAERTGSGFGSSTLAQCFLCPAGTLLLS